MDSIFDLDHLYRTYFKMALPSVFGLMVSVVYNLADTFFIAQSNDTALIAGVSLCAPVFTALMAFGNIYGQGGSSLISRLLGQDDREGTGRVSSFCFYVALTTGVVLAALMMLFRVPLLGILGATAETMPHAQAYYTVLAIGAPATVLNFIHSNLVRCEGMATQSMIGSIGGTVINIILDPILITTVGWGARGAAIATIVGYLCSDLYFLWLLHKKSRCLSVKLSQCHVTGRELQQILGVGVTAALSNLMQSLTVIVMNQFLLPYGNDKIAAMGIASKVSMIAQLVLVGFSFGGIPLFGYLYGAKKRDVMRKLIPPMDNSAEAVARRKLYAACLSKSAQDGEKQAVPYADWSAEKQAEYKLQAADLTTQGSAADTVSADMTQVDALSGATITSTAVTDIVNNSYFYVTEVLCAE